MSPTVLRVSSGVQISMDDPKRSLIGGCTVYECGADHHAAVTEKEMERGSTVVSIQRVIRLVLSISGMFVVIACGGGQSAPTPTVTASNAGGSFTQAQQVTFSSDNNAAIYYTTDGSPPTSSAQRYTSTLTLLTDMTLKAVAINSSGQSSGVLTLNFDITIPPPTLKASSSGGIFNTAQSISLIGNDAVRIFYTLDGSAPSDGSERYTSALIIESDLTLSGIAIDALGRQSDLLRVTFEFDFDAPTNFSLEPDTSVINSGNERAFPMAIVNGELGSNFSLAINDEESSSQVVLSGQVDTTNDLELRADLAGLADGVLTAVLTLTDAAGNDSVPFSLSLKKAADVGPVRVGAQIKVASGTQIDSDVNDVTVTNVANNSFADAQEIFAPGVLGGYVNQAGSGVSGTLFDSGDEDFFLVNLSAGDNILLTIPQSSADLDAELYDSARTLVDDSLGTGNTESLTAPVAGQFFIRVFPFSGASNYVLTVGVAGLVIASNFDKRAMSSFDDFAVNEAILKLEETAPEAVANLRKTMDMVIDQQAGQQADQPLLMAFKSVEARDATIASVSERLQSKRVMAPALGTRRTKQETVWAIKALARHAHVAAAEPNYWRRAKSTPDDPLYREQWHYPQIQLPDAWDITKGSRDVTVAVIDTGILRNHPDFSGQLLDGFDFISDRENSGDGDGADSDPEDVGDKEFADASSSFHGSHVAGTIAAATDNGIGVSGVAWNSRIIPLRALGRVGGSSYDIIQSIRYAAGLPNVSGTVPSRPADVINMSLGGSGYSQSEADAITAARNAGTIIIAAAGNSATGELEYPASYEGVVSVSATNLTNELTSYSNYGSMIDVAAPGGDAGEDANGDGFPDGILSIIGSDRTNTLSYGYRRYEGTSMAAPHVAGVAALMKSVYGAMTPAEFDRVLMEGRITDDLGDLGRDDRFGYGLINANKAVLTAQQLDSGVLQPLPASLLSSPQRLNLGVTSSQQSFTLTNAGGGLLTVNDFSDDAEWLSVAAIETKDQGLGSYLASVDRQSLADGSYSASISISSSAGELNIPVKLRVSSNFFSSNAGVLFALLSDVKSRETIYQQRLANPENGIYSLSFDGVEPGSYVFVVGSDMDNDNFICDAGEACGAYPTLNDEEDIEVIADANFELDVDFDQGRFFSVRSAVDGSDGNAAASDFRGFRYKDPVKSVDD